MSTSSNSSFVPAEVAMFLAPENELQCGPTAIEQQGTTVSYGAASSTIRLNTVEDRRDWAPMSKHMTRHLAQINHLLHQIRESLHVCEFRPCDCP